MTQLAGSAATVYFNGQQFQVSDWSMEVTTGRMDVTSVGSLACQYVPGPQSVTIRLGAEEPQQAVPREDLVKHLGTRCCCSHCPEGGDHG